MNNSDKILQKAKNYAFLLLKFRLRSERELYERLRKKKFEEGIIRNTLCFLKEKRFVDDNVFAKNWIQSRLRKPLGIRRIKQELILKGIAKEIIECQISEIKKSYCEQDTVYKIVQSRINKLKSINPDTAKRRLFAWLLRRGFSPEAVTEAINQLIKNSY